MNNDYKADVFHISGRLTQIYLILLALTADKLPDPIKKAIADIDTALSNNHSEINSNDKPTKIQS